MGDNGVADASAHFSGGAVGESDGDDLGHLDPVLAEVRKVALGKYERFAAAGTRREDDRHVAR